MWLLLLAAAQAAEPHTSYPKLVSANGFGAVIYTNDRLSDFYPHLYQEYSPGVVTPEVLYDTYFGWADGSAGGWWNSSVGASYVAGTNIVESRRQTADLSVTEYAFAPMSDDGVGLAQVLVVENTGSSTRAGFQIVSLHNWHVGGTENVASPDASHASEAGSDVTVHLSAPGATDASCADVYNRVLAGQTIGGGCNGSGSDMVPAFGWTIPALAPGERAVVGVYTSSGDPDGWIAGRDAATWLDDEAAWWSSWLSQAGPVDGHGLADPDPELHNQQLVFLKSAQVREPGDAFGQIAASLPLSAPVGDFQHIWNITWVRDGSYAAAALAVAGYPEEAADALAFMIQPGKSGDYRSYVGDMDYAVSVCRVYGDGGEWSDADATGPNIEFDNFGLFLWALGVVAEAGGDELVAGVLPAALDGVADVLVGLVDPSTGLLYPDSSIWERHWDGNQQQFTYSSTWAVAGLRAAAALAERQGDGRAVVYAATADTIAAGIAAHLVDADGVVAASREQLQSGGYYLDLAAVEAFNQGVLPLDERFDASVAAWNDGLRVASGHGYKRNDDGSTYDEHEWVMVDLRLAQALLDAGQPDEAQALVDWVADQATLNNDTLPELYDPADADYAGPAPMLGFGSGAWLWLYHRPAPGGGPDDGDDTGVDTADTAGEDTDSGKGPDGIVNMGCACGRAPEPGAGLGLLLLSALAAVSARRLR